VDFGSLQLAVALGMAPEPARIVSFTVGSTVVYLVNRRWTFTSRRDRREIGALALVLAATFALVGATNMLALAVLPDAAWRISLAWVISQGVATLFNFTAQRVLVFPGTAPRPAAAGGDRSPGLAGFEGTGGQRPDLSTTSQADDVDRGSDPDQRWQSRDSCVDLLLVEVVAGGSHAEQVRDLGPGQRQSPGHRLVDDRLERP
jgi:putative flippase GtrA